MRILNGHFELKICQKIITPFYNLFDGMTLKIAKLNIDDNFDDLDENDPELLEYEKQLEQYEQAYEAYLNSYKDWAEQYGQDANPPEPKATEVSSKRRRRRYFS